MSRRQRARIELGEDMRRGAPQFERRLRRYRFDVGYAANAVGAKDFLLLRHVPIQDPAALPVNRKVTPLRSLTCLRCSRS